MNALESTSTRPYLIRALYDWCTDNGLTPYVAVLVDDTVQVPREYVKNGEIVLNISFDATSSLKLGNDFIEFKARFAGTAARDHGAGRAASIAIYARENGQGMAFPVAVPAAAGEEKPSPLVQRAGRRRRARKSRGGATGHARAAGFQLRPRRRAAAPARAARGRRSSASSDAGGAPAWMARIQLPPV